MIIKFIMSIPPDINAFFDIDERIDEVDMDVSENEVDNVLDSILDVTNSVGHVGRSGG